MPLDERARTVQRGYNSLGPSFGEWTAAIEGDPWERFLEAFASRLEEGARIVDLGCGAGRVERRLGERFDVVGVDVSDEQLRLARANAAHATFVHGDFAQLGFPSRSLDGVIALYSIVHVPRDEHAELFRRVAEWLKPDGLFLASLSTVGGPDRTYEWLGVPMFFSGHDAVTNRRLLREAGFELLADEIVAMREPGVETAFHWVLGRRVRVRTA